MKRLLTIVTLISLFAAPAFSQKKDTYRVRTVVIDPGHGGAKPGAQGARSMEKTITLAIAKKFGKLIADNYPDVKLIYTRTTDVDISLAERARIANRNKADLFISIHANSHPTTTPTGVETFVMGLSESKANLEVARKENADILLEADYEHNEDYKDFDPNSTESYVMLAMFQKEFIDKSLNFAQAIQNQYKANLKTINRGVKQAELFVLYKTSMPSVLTEVGFISNPAEEAFMLSDEGQAKIAISLFNAFMNFKATEEGTARIAKPKIDLPGYSNLEDVKEEVAVAEPKQEAAPVVQTPSEAKQELKPAMTVEIVEEEAAPKVEVVERKKPAEPVQPRSTTSPERPVPTTELAPRPEQPKPEVKKEEPKPATPEPPAVKAQPEQPVQPAKPEQPATPVTPEKPAAPVQPAAPEKPAPPVQPAAPEKPAAPVTPVEPLDQYYTVQFLTSNKPYAQGSSVFHGLENVEVYNNGKSYCYSVGRFKTFQEASEYSRQVRETTPFKDAWAVMRKVKSGDVKPVVTAPKEETKGVAANKKAEGQIEAPRNTASDDAEEFFTVQILTSAEELYEGDPNFKGMQNVLVSHGGTLYHYSLGRFATFEEANEYSRQVHNNTSFADAWATRRKASVTRPVSKAPGAPASASESVTKPATKPAAKEKKQVSEAPKGKEVVSLDAKGVTYRVQIMSTRRKIEAGDPELFGITDFQVAKMGEYYVYTVGNYATKAQAESRCAALKKSTPFRDAIVVLYRDGKRVNSEL